MENVLSGLRGLLKLIIFVLFLATFLAWTFSAHLILKDSEARLRFFAKNTHFFAALALKILNVKVQVKNPPPADQKCLVVSNHMGFVDILMLSSSVPTVFVTSKEMKETPFLGTLTEMGGCIYVERRSRTKILDEMKSIVEVLRQGFRVTLYPEATSTNGERVLPFKRTLMMAAAQAGVPIQPVVVNFRNINGDHFNLKWRDHVCWYGDIPFATSAWKTLVLKSVVAEVEFLEQVHVSLDEDRGVIADKVHQMISTRFVPAQNSSSESLEGAGLEADPT